MPIDELLGGEGGRYRAHTRDSQYAFDLDDGTVQRFAGPISNLGANDVRRRIRDISLRRAASRGRWTMWPVDGDPDVQYLWQNTSEVRTIERQDANDANR